MRQTRIVRLPLNRVVRYATVLLFMLVLIGPTMDATEEPCTFPGFRAEITWVCEIGGQNLMGGPHWLAVWIDGTNCSNAVSARITPVQTNCFPAGSCLGGSGWLPGCASKPEGYQAQPVVFELNPVEPEAIYHFATHNGEFYNCTFTTTITDGALPPVTITTLIPHDGYPYEPRMITSYQPSQAGRKPTVTVTLLKKGIEAATGRRFVEGRLDYDMGGAPENWSIEARLLPWTSADGQTGGGELVLAPEVPPQRVGSRTFTFVAPSGAQQVSILGVASSCAGRATDDASIECGCDGTEDPVYFADGNVRVTDADPLPPIGNQQLIRTYNSDEQVVALFGRGWTSLFDRRMMRYTDGSEEVMSLVTETNEIVTFRGAGSTFRQTWPTSRAALGTLNYVSGTFIHRPAGAAEQSVFRESDGRLVALRDTTTGRETLIAYDMNGLPQTVTDSWSGTSWNLTVDGANRRVSSIVVSDRPDLLWTYSYTNGNLTTVFAPGNVVWRTYEYSANRMTASRDVLGNLIESHTYDADGYGISSTGPGDEIASIEYNLPGSNADERITRVTYNNGSTAEYTLRPAGGAWRPTHVSGGCASCGAGDTTYVRDSEGRPILEQAADGYITRTTYAEGRIQSEERALKPVGCDPQTDPQHCRLGTDALATASLEPTSATAKMTYEYADPLWPDRVTAEIQPSVRVPGQFRREETTYHPVTGGVASKTVRGWTGQVATEQDRVARTVLYGDVPVCDEPPCPPYDPYAPAFSPGGAFDVAWEAMPQPSNVLKSTDGPRADVADLANSRSKCNTRSREQE